MTPGIEVLVDVITKSTFFDGATLAPEAFHRHLASDRAHFESPFFQQKLVRPLGRIYFVPSLTQKLRSIQHGYTFCFVPVDMSTAFCGTRCPTESIACSTASLEILRCNQLRRWRSYLPQVQDPFCNLEKRTVMPSSNNVSRSKTLFTGIS